MLPHRLRFFSSSIQPPAATCPLLSSLLPPSQNPRRSTVDAIISSFKNVSPSPPSIITSFLGSDEITSILLRSSHSTPLHCFHFLFWAHKKFQNPTITTPLHFSLLTLSLTFLPEKKLTLLTLLTLLTTFSDNLTDPFTLLHTTAVQHNYSSASLSTALSVLIRAFLRLNRIEDAIKCSRRAIYIGLPPEVSSFNALIARIASDCRHYYDDECWKLFDEMRQLGIRRNKFTFNILVRVLIRGDSNAEDGMRVEEFLEEMEMEGFEPDLVTYNTLMDGYCRKGKVDDALQLFHVMPKRGLWPDLVSYTILIKGLCQLGRSGEALRMSGMMVKVGVEPDLIAYNVIIAGCSREGKMKEARMLLMRMIESGVKPDEFTCKVLVQGFVGSGKILTCLNVIVMLRKVGVCVPAACYERVICTLCSEMRQHAALSVLKWMSEDGHQLSLKILNLIIEAFCKSGCVEEPLRLKDEMVSWDVRPDIRTYGILVSCLCQAGRSWEGEQLVMEMVERGLLPDLAICHALVSGFLDEHDFDKAESLLHYFAKTFQICDSKSFNALIRKYCEYQDENRAFLLQDSMMKLGFIPNRETCKSLVYGLSSFGK